MLRIPISSFFLLLVLVACGSAPNQNQGIIANPPTVLPPTVNLPTVAPPPPTVALPTVPPPPPTVAATVALPTVPPPPPTVPAPSAAPVPPTAVPPTAAPGTPAAPRELLFLRQGALWAYALSDGRERQIVDSVRDFAAAPNGAQIALIRDGRGQRDLWVVQRDGSGLTQLSNDARSEATPIWAPDNSAIMYASASDKQPYQREWIAWSAWCATSEVRQVVLATSTVSTITPGCDPAISPDGRRLAVASPPEQNEPGLSAENPPKIVNAIRLVNRQGQNGWNFARADGDPNATSNAGRDVYAPAFSPDGQQVLYHRFLGYQVLVDISLSEIGGSFEGKGKPMYSGAGWLLPAQFAADSRSLVISENNYSDARGFGGYDNWSATVIRMEGNREVAMPSGPLTMLGQNVETLRRAQAAIWVPGSSELFVQLPPGWRADLPTNEPLGATGPGEIWRWKPGEGPQQRLVSEVDFASPLGWLR